MGTKNKPGSFDCHAAAHDDEPLFTLLARDPLASYLVRVWAAVRTSDPETAIRVFETMMAREMPRYTASPDYAKALEAQSCAMAMFDYRERNYDGQGQATTAPDVCMAVGTPERAGVAPCPCGSTPDVCPYRAVQS